MELAKQETRSADTTGLDDLFDGSSQTDDSATSIENQSDTLETSVSEAAQLLGVTERTVWRRIRQGKIKSELVGGKAVVTISQSDIKERQPDSHTDDQTDQCDRATDVSVIQTDIVDVSKDSKALELVAELSAKLEAATYRNGYLEAQLDGQREQLKLLPDYQHRAGEAEVLRVKLSDLEKELDGYRASRWTRFWRWFVGQ